MSFTVVAIGIYAIIALVAMGMTLAEFLTSDESTPGFFAMGLLACAAWPLTIAGLGVVMAFQPAPVHDAPAAQPA